MTDIIDTFYTVEDIPWLEEELEEELTLSKEYDKDNDHRDYYFGDNTHRREAHRIKKLIDLVKLCEIVRDYQPGLVLVNDKFVVSLLNNTWRVLHKNKWYKHKNDLQHFVNNYVYKDRKYETNT
jgi:hypothetical protein